MFLRNFPASQMLVARLSKLHDKQFINRYVNPYFNQFIMTSSIDKNTSKSSTENSSHSKDAMTQMKMNNENSQKEGDKGIMDYSEEPIGQAIYLRSRQESLNDIAKQFEKGEMYSLSVDPISGYPLNED